MKPITYYCTDDGMVPLARFSVDYERQFQAGKYYALAPVIERSAGQHGLYFKCVTVAWDNLPHEFGENFKTDEHYRQHCLIEAGFLHQRSTLYSTHEDAKAAAADVKSLPTYSECEVVGRRLTTRTAKTQKYKRNDPDGMDKKDFKASMDAVLLIAAGDIGLTVEQLVEEAKKQMVRLRRSPSLQPKATKQREPVT